MLAGGWCFSREDNSLVQQSWNLIKTILVCLLITCLSLCSLLPPIERKKNTLLPPFCFYSHDMWESYSLQQPHTYYTISLSHTTLFLFSPSYLPSPWEHSFPVGNPSVCLCVCFIHKLLNVGENTLAKTGYGINILEFKISS